MTTIPPTIGRARLQQTSAGLRIVIPPLRSWYLFLEGPVITSLVVSVILQIEQGIVVWIIIAALLVAGLGRRWLWNLIGHEIVTINKVALSLRSDFGGLGWQRTYFLDRLYRLCFVRLMTAQEFKEGTDNPSVGLVSFNYDAPASRFENEFSVVAGLFLKLNYDPQSPRFGRNMDEADVKELIGVMESYGGGDLSSTEPPPPQPLPGGIIGQESNSNWGVAYVMSMMAGVLYFLGTLLDDRVQKFGLFAASLFFLGVGVLAVAGYRFRFTRDGVEISTLGFRLCFIPVNRITHWEESGRTHTDSYRFGLYGTRKAYVWAGRGVRIHTLDGDFLLGHMNPEILLRDLELMKQFASGGGALGQAAGAGKTAASLF